MNHAQIAANARAPYAAKIRELVAAQGELLELLEAAVGTIDDALETHIYEPGHVPDDAPELELVTRARASMRRIAGAAS